MLEFNLITFDIYKNVLELEESTNEFWIVFRKKLYIFEDFLKSWHKKLNETESSPLVTRILHEIHKYQVLFPSVNQ